MTLVHFHLADAEGRGLDGSVSLVPTRRVTVRDAIRLPVAQTVKLDKGEATAEVMPSTTQWVWRVSELVAGGIVRYVEVPDKESAEYSGLVDVDPATLDQSSETVAAWETVTRAAQAVLDQIGSIDDKVARAESSAQAAKASEGVAGQESAKAADAAAKALASQTAAASSASLAHEAETTAQGLIGEARSIAAQITDKAAQAKSDAATADTAAKTAGDKAAQAIDAQSKAEAASQAAETAMRAATEQATAAGESASAANASETAAAKSAESAGQSKSAASASESAAARSATAASDSAAKAKDSETAAKTSAASAEHADTASAAASEAAKTLEQLRKWFPAATMRTDLWMEPVDFAVAGPYEIPGQPTIRLKPVAVYLDGHTSDVDASMASRDAAVATLDGQTLTWVSNATTLSAALKSDGYQPAEVTIKAGGTTVTKHVYLQADQPDGVVGDLWVRTEKLHNGLRYYTGAYGTAAADANSMFFLVDRPREIWRKTIDGWTLLTGKELE
ncbi:hypothetical protein [Bifidobacterium bifidum]|uniref:hypothetical protein n=1 Tax=Bifidobacterium bifidum TaxID=1681 RepID=UPI00324CD77A